MKRNVRVLLKYIKGRDISSPVLSIRSDELRDIMVYDDHSDVMRLKDFLEHWPFLRGIHRWTVDSSCKRPVMRNFDVFVVVSLGKLLNCCDTAAVCMSLTLQSWLNWGRVTVNRPIIDSDNYLSPVRHRIIIWIIAGLKITEHMGTNISEIGIKMQPFSFKKMNSKMSSAKRRPFCLGLNVLN